MKFLEYLNEKAYQGSRDISEQAAIEFARKYCKQNLTERPVLYKGLDRSNGSYDDYKIVRPSKTERESANTSNFYTWMIDSIFKNWSRYPKRSRSVICSTSQSTADNYADGNTYVVVPIDGSKIGVCPEDDMWGSFPEIQEIFGGGLDDFNLALSRAFYNRFKMSDIDSFIEFRKALDDFDEYLVNFHEDNILSSKESYDEEDDDDKGDFVEPDFSDSLDFLFTDSGIDIFETYNMNSRKLIKGIVKHKSFTNLLEDLFDPDNNDFNLARSTKTLIGYDNRECWTDGNCLYIDIEKYDEFYNNVKDD